MGDDAEQLDTVVPVTTYFDFPAEASGRMPALKTPVEIAGHLPVEMFPEPEYG